MPVLQLMVLKQQWCVLLVHHHPAINATNVFFFTGKDSRNVTHKRYIHIHKSFDKLTLEERNILLTVYCISGCDTVSAFFGHGKAPTFKIMRKNARCLQPLLGGSQHLAEEVGDACVAFVGLLYRKVKCTSLNALRCEKATRSTVAKSSYQLKIGFISTSCKLCFSFSSGEMQLLKFIELPRPVTMGLKQMVAALKPNL